jgi:hypothetical protein
MHKLAAMKGRRLSQFRLIELNPACWSLKTALFQGSNWSGKRGQIKAFFGGQVALDLFFDSGTLPGSIRSADIYGTYS